MNSILNLKMPIIGLSPMDAVTDSPYRFIMQKYGNPDIVFTEFTNVMGMCIAGDKIMHTFHYDEAQRPIVGQIYGKEPEYFYHASKIICALGFDAVDINMGCPAKNVASSGAGAGLIRTPELSKEIIASVKKGVEDWVRDGKLTGLSERSLEGFNELLEIKRKEVENIELTELSSKGFQNLVSQFRNGTERVIVPTSVKTRIGYDKPITAEWVKNISEANPEWITVHGRTLKQMYAGKADWNEIRIAVESTHLPILANGDIVTTQDAKDVLELTGAAGVLIGRGTYGNPWIFKEIKGEIKSNSVDLKTRIKVMVEHTEKFLEIYPDPKMFFQMRKHFGWYMKGFDGAVEMRKKLFLSSSIEEVKEIVKDYL